MTTPATDRDHLAIRQTALDYCEGWYEGNAERMQRSLHPGLAKRSIKQDPKTGEEFLNLVTQEEMVSDTRAGLGSATPPDKRSVSLVILDQYETIACVRCESYAYVEYLSLAKQGERWLIVNCLYAHNRARP